MQGTTRTVVRSCRIGRVDIAPGQKAVPLFVAVDRDPADVQALTACIDYVIEKL